MRVQGNRFVLGLSLLILSSSAYARPGVDGGIDANGVSPYFQISAVHTKLISTEILQPEVASANAGINQSRNMLMLPSPTPAEALGNDLSGLGSGLSTLGGLASGASSGGALGIAQVALKVWDIIQDNRAVANVSMTSTSALPTGASQNWQSMTGWQPERAVRFSVEAENGFGMTVVSLQYEVRVLSGGNLDGKGLYIATARVLPTAVKVLWGFNLDVTVNVASTYNAGTESDPLAEIALDVQYKYGSIMNSNSGTNSYLVRGDGFMQDTSNGKVFFEGSTQ